MLRVCFYVFGFPPDFSGATLQTLYLAHFLRKKKVDFFFLTYTYDKKNLTQNKYGPYRVIRFLRSPTNKLLNYHLKLFLKLYLTRRRFDVLYINGNDGQFWTLLWVLIYCKIFAKRLFVELNMHTPGKDPLSIKGTKLANMKLVFAKRVNKFISNSTAITKNFNRSYPTLKNIETIFYGVDTERFKKLDDPEERLLLRTKLGLGRTMTIAMTCGGISRRKGIDFLLDCWEAICCRFKNDCLLVVVGPYDKQEGYDVSFTNGILKRVASQPLLGKVKIIGHVDNVHEYMKACDLFLFTSRQEGSPSVIREAMSSSLPVVSLNLPDITTDLIENGKTGILVFPKDYQNLINFQHEPINAPEAKQKFIEATVNIMSDSSLAKRLGSSARRTIEKNCSFENKTERYLTLFETSS